MAARGCMGDFCRPVFASRSRILHIARRRAMEKRRRLQYTDLPISPAERCWSGRTGLPAKQLHPKRVSGVRIPPSPPRFILSPQTNLRAGTVIYVCAGLSGEDSPEVHTQWVKNEIGPLSFCLHVGIEKKRRGTRCNIKATISLLIAT